MMKRLKDLTLHEHSSLKSIGFLYEFYPEATGNWETDCGPKTNEEKLEQIKGWVSKLRELYVSEGMREDPSRLAHNEAVIQLKQLFKL